jgi:hypothetical protein
MMKVIKPGLLLIGIFLAPVVIFHISCAYHNDRIKLDEKRRRYFLSLGQIQNMQLVILMLNSGKYELVEKPVIETIGTPLNKWKPYGQNTPVKRNYIGFVYSQDHIGSYRLRQENFDKGIVAEIIHYFYID